MQYISTRDAAKKVSAAEAIVMGLAPGGGLFVPAEMPKLNIQSLRGTSYEQVAFAVLRCFLPEYDDAFLQGAIDASYGKNFDGKAGELVKLEDGLFSLELWHGPTAAFKDYALQLMPKLLVQGKQMLHDEDVTMVLVATSGDTGKAALEGFKDLAGTQIVVFYPESGTSEIQRLQMVTQAGENVAVYGVQGNFDDAQRGVKMAFGDIDLAAKLAEKGVKLSSANSINWGRLVPQVVYYVTSYLTLCAKGDIAFGDALDFCVPTGNFGDIMAGWYAKQLGVPIGKLVCASNRNNVLTEFLQTGLYNARRDFHKTSSPSMDIVVSSNLERMLFHASGSDEKVRGWMRDLEKNGEYQVDNDTLARICDTFMGGWADEADVSEEIVRIYREYRYLCDPHTAVAFRVLREGRAQGLMTPTVVLSTANPFKFCGKVLAALGQAVPANEFDALRALEDFSGEKAPESLSLLQEKPVRFREVIDPATIAQIPLGLGK